MDCDLWRLEFNSDSSEAILILEDTTLLIWGATPFAGGGVALKTHNFGPQFFLESRGETQTLTDHTSEKRILKTKTVEGNTTTRLPSFGGGRMLAAEPEPKNFRNGGDHLRIFLAP